jgi:pyruvate carboxylase
VEHTITEQVTGVDIVQSQIRIAGGATLADLGLATQVGRRRGATVERGCCGAEA